MATAKTKLGNTSFRLKPECAICLDEDGSYACIRPAHEAYQPKSSRKVEQPVTKEVLATAITQISDSVKSLEKTGLNRRAVIALLADDTKLGKGTITTVLNSLGDLAKNYTK
jgi:hypothetical protein